MCLIVDPLFVTCFRLYNQPVCVPIFRSLLGNDVFLVDAIYIDWFEHVCKHNVQTSARSLFAASPELRSFRVLNGTGTLHIHKPQDYEFEIDTNLQLVGNTPPKHLISPNIVVQGFSIGVLGSQEFQHLICVPKVLGRRSGSQQGVFFSGLGLDRFCFFQFVLHAGEMIFWMLTDFAIVIKPLNYYRIYFLRFMQNKVVYKLGPMRVAV